MIKFRSPSIKDKLVLLILSVTALSIIIAFLLNVISSRKQFKEDMTSETRLYAEFLGESVISPLLFNDVPGGNQILSKLHTVHWIDEVVVFDSNNREFARFSRIKTKNVKHDIYGTDVTRFIKDRLFVSRKIVYMDENLGRILVVASTIELKKKINDQMITMGAIVLLVLALSYWVALKLQRIISIPILHLAEVAKQISREGDYSIRVIKQGDDEIGMLYDGFNVMLTQIQNRDIENKEAERNIRVSEAHLSEAQRIASLGSWEWDVINDKVVFSEGMYRLLDYEKSYTPSIDILAQGMYKKGRSRLLIYLKNAKENGESFEITCHHKVMNKGVKILLIRGVVIKNTDGTANIVHCTAQDVTKQKKAENEIRKLNEELEKRVKERTEELQAVNEELEQFAYVVSHDLKAPLRGVSQLSQWLLEDYGNKLDTEGREHLNLMKQRIHRMYNLINGILEYSRVGRIKQRKYKIDINLLVQDIIEALSPPKHIRIEIGNKLPIIFAERTRVEQVFQNLISNAIKFNDKKQGIITIYCVDDNTHWKFSISDNGPGIEKKYHERIYQIFQTLAARDERESTGIGLTLVKKIVELLGGRIWLESEPKLGTTFYFTFVKRLVSIPQQDTVEVNQESKFNG